MSGILVLAECRNQSLTDESRHVLSKGRRLADEAQIELLAAVIGKDTGACAKEVAKWANKVIAIKVDKLEKPLAEPYQKVLSTLIKERKPKIMLMGHSSFGMDMAPALAVEMEAPLATDCVDIFLQNGDVMVKRSIYNGKVNAVYSFAQSETVITTGRASEFPITESQVGGKIEEIDFTFKEEFSHKKFDGFFAPEAGAIDITQTEVLVSVGRGIKEKGNLNIAEELAQALNGMVSCSRPVVDYGWLSSEHQVGQSGKTVQPKLYISLGISGAFQHVVGMKGTKIIVAINKDAKAPIFKVANYGIVDDIFKVVPALTHKITELKG